MKKCVAGCMVFADGIRHHKDCPLSSDAMLGEVRELFNDLLSESMTYYTLYPNSHRCTAEEYFKRELEMKKKLDEHFT